MWTSGPASRPDRNVADITIRVLPPYPGSVRLSCDDVSGGVFEMAVYSSKFATKNVVPRGGRDHRYLKRFASVLLVVAVLGLGAFGLWRATAGMPEPSEIPAVGAE